MAILTAPRCQGRDHGMAQPRKHAPALTPVIQRVFSEGPGESIARRCGYRGDPEVGPESLAVTGSALLPLWRCIVRLVDASSKCGAHDWIGPKRIEQVAMKLHLRCRANICQVWVLWGRDCNRARRVSRFGQCLRFCRERQGCHDPQQKHHTAL